MVGIRSNERSLKAFLQLQPALQDVSLDGAAEKLQEVRGGGFTLKRRELMYMFVSMQMAMLRTPQAKLNCLRETCQLLQRRLCIFIACHG
jgi:cell fate (sporulation/competence/biofilm development) regulator YlbF (YheA/YmcA/DUF963 family)